mmetsp:Transcript_5474/g.23161  ORF Transcript_5474/g.23161 Transcript_5474/m.23161 type:complete len:92 (+) Transcript_5474:208-483(+)
MGGGLTGPGSPGKAGRAGRGHRCQALALGRGGALPSGAAAMAARELAATAALAQPSSVVTAVPVGEAPQAALARQAPTAAWRDGSANAESL